jgi:hypothetical protein
MLDQLRMSNAPATRTPVLRAWCVKTSIVLAGVAWLEFIAFGIIAYFKAGHDLFFLLMIPVWPFAYGFVWAVANGMVQLHTSGPNSRRFPPLFCRLMPQFYFDLVDYIFPFMANLPLLLFPGMMTIMGAFMVWIALVGKLNVHL